MHNHQQQQHQLFGVWGPVWKMDVPKQSQSSSNIKQWGPETRHILRNRVLFEKLGLSIFVLLQALMVITVSWHMLILRYNYYVISSSICIDL